MKKEKIIYSRFSVHVCFIWLLLMHLLLTYICIKAMIFGNGVNRIDFNNYNEGWFEVVMFIAASIYSLITYIQLRQFVPFRESN